MGTYEMIKAVPAKGFDWMGFNATLRGIYVEMAGRNIESWIAQEALKRWDGAKGMREIRASAMEMASNIVSDRSRRCSRIAPSQESQTWDSFEGGHIDVWTDQEAEAAETQKIAGMIANFKGGK